MSWLPPLASLMHTKQFNILCSLDTLSALRDGGYSNNRPWRLRLAHHSGGMSHHVKYQIPLNSEPFFWQPIFCLWLLSLLGPPSTSIGYSLGVPCIRFKAWSFGEPFHWHGGYRAAAIWNVIAGAFALRSEPVIRPFPDYSGKTPDKDPFNAMDPAPTISCPLGYDVAAAPSYKPVDHIEAALHRM